MDWTDRVGRRLSPRDLHVFIAVVEEKSMLLAAEKLAISRPVVSKAIAGLEHILGVKLFDRTPRGVTPTKSGDALYRRAIAVFDELKKSVQEIETIVDPSAGELTLGSIDTLMAGFTSAAISGFCDQYPNARITSLVGNIAILLDALVKRQCELALLREPPSGLPHIFAKNDLFHEHMSIVVGKRNPLAKKRKLELKELTGEKWILAPAATEIGSPLSQAFSQIDLPAPQPAVVSQSHWLRLVMLTNQNYVTMFPNSSLMFGTAIEDVKVLPISVPRWEQPIVVAWLKDRSLTPIAQNFISSLRAVAAALN